MVSVNTTLFARVAPTAKSLGVYGSGTETVSATPSSQVIVSPNARAPATGASGSGSAAPGSSGAGSGSTGTSGIASSILSNTVPSDPMRNVTSITMPTIAAMIDTTSPVIAGHFAPRRNRPMSESTNGGGTRTHAKPLRGGVNGNTSPTIATTSAMMPTTFGPGFDGSVNGCCGITIVEP